MKVIVFHEYGGPEVLVVEEVPIPEPTENEVRVKVKFTSLNAGDYRVRNGSVKDFFKIKKFPVTFGFDVAGIVDKIGSKVTSLKVGDEVCAYRRLLVHKIDSGTYCEYTCIPEECCSSIYKLGSELKLSWEEAASLPVGALTAYQLVFDFAKTKKDQNCLIIGASGGVGSFALQFSKLGGCNKIICIGSERNHHFLKNLGATHCIDYKSPNINDEIKKICPNGVELIFDCFTNRKEQLEIFEDLVLENGKIGSISNFSYQIGNNCKKNVEFGSIRTRPDGKQLQMIVNMVIEKKLKCPIERIWKFDDVQEAFKVFESSNRPPGKMVIQIS